MRWPSESWRTGVSRNVVQVEQLDGSASRLARYALGRHPVDVAQQLERVAQRQVPPELRALAEHHADAPRQLDALPRPARGRPPRSGPPVGTRMPVSILIVVDLPAPFGPM